LLLEAQTAVAQQKDNQTKADMAAKLECLRVDVDIASGEIQGFRTAADRGLTVLKPFAESDFGVLSLDNKDECDLEAKWNSGQAHLKGNCTYPHLAIFGDKAWTTFGYQSNYCKLAEWVLSDLNTAEDFVNKTVEAPRGEFNGWGTCWKCANGEKTECIQMNTMGCQEMTVCNDYKTENRKENICNYTNFPKVWMTGVQDWHGPDIDGFLIDKKNNFDMVAQKEQCVPAEVLEYFQKEDPWFSLD